MNPTPEDKPTFARAGLLLGVRRTLPLAVSATAFAAVFGVLARQSGLTLVEAAMMSGLVFAGAAQFIALQLWISPLPIFTIIFTTLIVNLRHVLMGAALRPWLSKLPASKVYGSIFFMTDETWALSIKEYREGERDAAFILGSGLTLFTGWVGGTVAGTVAGSALRQEDLVRWGLDFMFAAVFTALLAGMWRGKSDLLPWGVAALVAVVAKWWLPGTWYILAGGIAGSVVGALRDAG
ncbi:MAG TPA: AzlC family ABC transporter permease [Chloroflexia bacterium]|nr:AzlC family ABC transporter permease [Chloroflexia bacterium]